MSLPRALLIHRPGTLIAAFPALVAATPALAAAFDAPIPIPMRELLLLGSLLLLGVALALRVSSRHRHADHSPEGPDMRWWKDSY